jgi:hypothetical protein
LRNRFLAEKAGKFGDGELFFQNNFVGWFERNIRVFLSVDEEFNDVLRIEDAERLAVQSVKSASIVPANIWLEI